MATPGIRASIKVDFVISLPLEILIEILTSLTITDVFSCMGVCKEWYVKIKSITTYWKVAAKSLGLSLYVVQQSKGTSPDYYSLVLNAWKSRQCISSSSPEVVFSSSRYPHHIYFQCNYSRYGTLVGTLYEDFSPEATVVYKIQPGSKKLVKKNQFEPVSYTPLGRICWSNVYCDYLLTASACGRWQGFNLATNSKLLDWKGPELYDQDILIGCCQQCYLVVVAKLVSKRQPMESLWEVDVINLGRGYSNPTIFHCNLVTPSYISPSTINYGCRNLEIISKIRSQDKGGFCNRHLLLLQWADMVSVHEVIYWNQINETPMKVFCSNLDDVNKEMLQLEKHSNTPFCLSSDDMLLGFLFTSKLHVWNLCTLQQESCINVQQQKDSAQVCLLALGHIYSLIGYESIEGRLKVISTYTGQCVFATHGFSGILGGPKSTIGTPPPYFIFLGVVDEHWLSNTQALPHPCMPVILYWEKREHCVFGIVMKPANYKQPDMVHTGIQNITETQSSWWKKRLAFL